MIPVLIVNVTNRCNSSCKYCWISNSQLKTTTNELTTSEIKKILTKAPKIGVAIITGGEPFLRDDLYEIVMSLRGRTRTIVITTNGIETKKIKTLLNRLNTPLNFQLVFAFSIDGPEEYHNQVKGNSKAYQNMLNSYQEVKNTDQKNIKTSFAFTYTASNQKYLRETISLLKKIVKPNSLTVTFPRGAIPSSELSNLDTNTYLKTCADIRRYNNISSLLKMGKTFGSLIDWIKRRLIVQIYKNKPPLPSIKCIAGKKVIEILPDGDVPICELRSEILGNLREHNYNLIELLHTKQAKIMLNTLKKNPCICTHECFLGPTIVFNLFTIITNFIAVSLRATPLFKIIRH